MKILHVDKYLRRQGGAAGYMLDVSLMQRSMGHTVEYFSMADPANEPSALERFFPRSVTFEPWPGTLADRARAFGTMLWSRDAARGMAGALDAFDPDVVHLHTFYHQLSPSILRPAALRRIPCVMSVHDYKLLCPSYRMSSQGKPCEACLNSTVLTAVRKRCKNDSVVASAALAAESGLHRTVRAYQSIRSFICPSRFMFDKMTSSDAYGSRSTYLPHFVDVPSAPVWTGPRSGCIYAGRLSEEKGIDTLIRAVGATKGVSLRVAGDGPLRQELEQLARSIAPGQVTFLGHLPKAQLLRELGKALLSVAPSRWYENQPIAVLEAMACGTAPVVTRIGGLPELVQHGKSGQIVPVDDVNALAAALQLLFSPATAVKMGDEAKRSVALQYSADSHAHGLEAIYAAARA